jgi:zinc transporter 2
VWTLTVGKTALAVHLTINPNQNDSQALTVYDYNHILSQVQKLICRKWNIHHSTIQLELGSGEEQNIVGRSFTGHCGPDV